jgi:hypothetical protein
MSRDMAPLLCPSHLKSAEDRIKTISRLTPRHTLATTPLALSGRLHQPTSPPSRKTRLATGLPPPPLT